MMRVFQARSSHRPIGRSRSFRWTHRPCLYSEYRQAGRGGEETHGAKSGTERLFRLSRRGTGTAGRTQCNETRHAAAGSSVGCHWRLARQCFNPLLCATCAGAPSSRCPARCGRLYRPLPPKQKCDMDGHHPKHDARRMRRLVPLGDARQDRGHTSLRLPSRISQRGPADRLDSALPRRGERT